MELAKLKVGKVQKHSSAAEKVQFNKKLAKIAEQESAAKKFQVNSELARLKGERLEKVRLPRKRMEEARSEDY